MQNNIITLVKNLRAEGESLRAQGEACISAAEILSRKPMGTETASGRHMSLAARRRIAAAQRARWAKVRASNKKAS